MTTIARGVPQSGYIASPQPMVGQPMTRMAVPQVASQRVVPSYAPPLPRTVKQRWTSWVPQVTIPWYGASPEQRVDVYEPKSRRRLNFISILQSVLIPWLLFATLTAALAFEIHYRRPWFVYMFCGFGFASVAIVGFIAVDANLRFRSGLARGIERDFTWFSFLFLTMAFGWLGAIVLGDYIYHSKMVPFFDMRALNSYVDVDPARMLGEQVMDGGRVQFTDDTALDLSKSTGFRNGDTYCVAPIATDPMEGRFDFWAVGMGCCSGVGNDFACGEYNNRNVHGGLRLMDDTQRAYYRLAVQQAEASFGISAPHPVFYHWVQDPWQSVSLYRQQAMSWYLAGISAFFVMQCFFVVSASLYATVDREGIGVRTGLTVGPGNEWPENVEA